MGWVLPEDYAGPVTELEKELGELGQGPRHEWHSDFGQGSAVYDAALTAPEPSARAVAYEQIKASGVLSPLADSSLHLQAHVASRMVNAQLAGEPLDLQQVLSYAVDKGHPQLAEEAQACLQAPCPKAGASPAVDVDAILEPAAWDEQGFGKGTLRFCAGDLLDLGFLEYVDLQDRLFRSDSGPLGLPSDEIQEIRQCLLLHVGYVRTPHRDPKQQDSAMALRNELWERAQEAFGHLGDSAPLISEAEAFVRHNAHDCLYSHHEKDYRVLHLFAPGFLSGFTLLVLRLSHDGQIDADVLRGVGSYSGAGAVLVHRGHMRALTLQGDAVEDLIVQLQDCGRVSKELEAEGWEAYLEQDPATEYLPSKSHPCLRCQRPQTPCRVGVEDEPSLWDPAAVPTPSGPSLGGRCQKWRGDPPFGALN